MKRLLCPAILLFLVCCADYDEIEGLSAGLGASYWRSSEAVARDKRIDDILYFSDDDAVFEYEGYQDGTPVSSAKTAHKYSYRKVELIIYIADVQHRGLNGYSGIILSIYDFAKRLADIPQLLQQFTGCNDPLRESVFTAAFAGLFRNPPPWIFQVDSQLAGDCSEVDGFRVSNGCCLRINPVKSAQLIWGMQTTSPVWVVMLTSFKDDSLRFSFFAFPPVGAWISNGTIW